MIDRNTMLKAEKGDKESQYELCLYYVKEGIFNFAFFWAQKSAKQGFAPAMFKLGEFYRMGIGTKINLKLAHKWLKKATKKRNIDATNWLIGDYLVGIFKTSNRKMLSLCKKSSKKDSRVGEYYLGLCYFKGIGVRKNVKKAKEHLQSRLQTVSSLQKCNLATKLSPKKTAEKSAVFYFYL